MTTVFMCASVPCKSGNTQSLWWRFYCGRAENKPPSKLTLRLRLALHFVHKKFANGNKNHKMTPQPPPFLSYQVPGRFYFVFSALLTMYLRLS